MKFTDLEHLLSVRLGFDMQTVGPQAIDSAVRQSMEEAGYSDPGAYAQMLTGNPEEWNRLVDRVVIPETWFFRDIAPFELAASLGREHMRRGAVGVFRALSCPCSTGEEPYSLAMALLHAGVLPESFSVDAVDVSRRALEIARIGEYRVRSFRENAVWFRDAYCDHTEGTGMWRVKDFVSSLVTFRHGNLIWPDFLEDDEPYDLVFCRNLLIYLHPEARSQAMANLRRLVKENGVLVLGHAEAAFARENGFTPTGPVAAFAFSNPAVPSAPKLKVPLAAKPSPSASVPSRPFVMPMPPPQPAPAAPLAKPPASNGSTVLQYVPPPSLLDTARELGDSGQLREALRVCGEHLQRVPDSAEGYFLQGILHDALGQPDQATNSFRKVLYLQPTHREALLHLALKHEARGDESAAALLWARARRAEDLSPGE